MSTTHVPAQVGLGGGEGGLSKESNQNISNMTIYTIEKRIEYKDLRV
jgi:hypothetical protein